MGSPEASEGGVQQRELPTVRVATVGTRDMARTLETTSKLESEREIAIEVDPRAAVSWTGGNVFFAQQGEASYAEIAATRPSPGDTLAMRTSTEEARAAGLTTASVFCFTVAASAIRACVRPLMASKADSRSTAFS